MSEKREGLPPQEEVEKIMESRNFNDHVLINITPRGEQLLREHYMRDFEGLDTKKLGIDPEDFIAKKLEKDENGWTEMTLWEVMNIFGTEVSMGNQEMPIKMTFQLERQKK